MQVLENISALIMCPSTSSVYVMANVYGIYGAKYSIIILVPFQGQLVNNSSTLIMIFSFDSTLASKLKVWGYTIL